MRPAPAATPVIPRPKNESAQVQQNQPFMLLRPDSQVPPKDRSLTIARTCVMQQRNALEFLCASVSSHRPAQPLLLLLQL